MEMNFECFINQLIQISKKNHSKIILEFNYNNSNGNGPYHFLSKYSLEKFYELNYNKEKDLLIDEDRYNYIIKEYKTQIKILMKVLTDLEYDINISNKNNQSPLVFCIQQKNYFIAKEYLIKLNNDNILKEKDYQEIFTLLVNSGDCMRNDCIELILCVLSIVEESKIKVFDKTFLNKEDKNGMTPLLLISKDYSDNIYEKYNQMIKMKSSIFKNNFNEIEESNKENNLAEIELKSKNNIKEFVSKFFFPLINKLIILGADINYVGDSKIPNKSKSVFLYLMTLPLFKNISLFIQENNIDINHQDNKGYNAFMYLIKNHDKIFSFSKEAYQNAFNCFIKNNINMEAISNHGISVFGLCLMKDLFHTAKILYDKKFDEKITILFNAEILIFIINFINKQKEYKYIIRLLQIFPFKFSIYKSLFNKNKERSLLHYICMYSSMDNTKFYIFKEIYLEYIKHFNKGNIIDIYNRIPLFYFFIDDKERIKINDPFFKLELCLKKTLYNNLNQNDIYGNNLLFYAVQAKAYKSIKLLIDFGVSLSHKNNDKNTIYSLALLIGDYDLFVYMYDFNKNNKIFNYPIYYASGVEFIQKEENVVQIIKGIYKRMNEPLPKLSIFKEEIENNIDKNNNNIIDLNQENKKSKFNSLYIKLNSEKSIYKLDQYTKLIKIKDKEKKDLFSIDQESYSDIIRSFKNKSVDIKSQNKYSNKMLSQSLFEYSVLNHYQNFCRFMIKENYHPITICQDLLSLGSEYKDELERIINQILYEKDLINYKNEEDNTIFHILSKINKDISFYKEKSLEKYNLSKLFNKSGNTPLYYACQSFNENFIEFFTNYSFTTNKINNNEPNESKEQRDINYFLFIETNNQTNPLKSLYFQIINKNMQILKLIIDISINTKNVYILNVILYLVKNYYPKNEELFLLPYNENLKMDDYLRKVIGLYSFYTQELKGNFSKNEFQENNPIFYCIKYNNYDFLFNILLKEKSLEINSVNKEGKNFIHLLIEKDDINSNKKDILNKALEAGFDFNIKDKKGLLPIDYAYLSENEEIIYILKNKYNSSGITVSENKKKEELDEKRDEEEDEDDNPNIFFYVP